MLLNNTINQFLRKKNTELVKRSKLITQQAKPTESSSIFDIKSVAIKHPKPLHKNIQGYKREAKNVAEIFSVGTNSTSPLYKENSKTWKMFG